MATESDKARERSRKTNELYRARGNGIPPNIGLCYMCLEVSDKLEVDHCHESRNKNRGLLCRRCNLYEGKLTASAVALGLRVLDIPEPQLDETLSKEPRRAGISDYDRRRLAIMTIQYLKTFGNGWDMPEAKNRIEELRILYRTWR